MDYKKIIQDAFSAVSSSRSDEEISSNVIERTENMNKKTKKTRSRCVAAIAAAVAVSTGTVAVGAACGWDFAQLFNMHFENKADDYILPTNIESQADTVDLTEMGNDILQSFEFEYGRVDFKSYISDSSNIMLMYTLDIDEQALGEHHQDHAYWQLSDAASTSSAKSDSGQGYRNADGSFTYCTTYSYGENKLSNGDIFRIEYTELHNFNTETYTSLPLREPIVLEITLENINTSYKEIKCSRQYTDDGYSHTLDKIIISPLSIDWYSLRGEAAQSNTELWAAIEYTLSDGTAIKCYDVTGTDSGKYDYFSAKLDKPVDPYDVTSVTICGIKIPVE